MELRFLRSRNWIAAFTFSLSLRPCSRLNRNAHLDLQNLHNLHSCSIHHSDQGTQNFEFYSQNVQTVETHPPSIPLRSYQLLQNNFKLPLISNLTPLLPHIVLLDAKRKYLAGYWRSGKFCNQTNLPQNQPIYLSLCVWHILSSPLQQQISQKPATYSAVLSFAPYYLLFYNLLPSLLVASSSAAMCFPPP